jgi:uncharacterized LabA/DUF88 family protein
MMKLQTKNSFNRTVQNFSWRGNFGRRNFRSQPVIERQTKPLSAIQGRKILVLADVENLIYSSRDLGYTVSFSRLTKILLKNSITVALHAFFSRETVNDWRIDYFRRTGWTVHTREIQNVQTHRGAERRANCDNLLLFTAGLLASRSNADTIAIASGDGDLVCSLIEGLQNLPKPREVVTMSLAGSTSWRLDATKNPNIRANIEIGLDCLKKY